MDRIAIQRQVHILLKGKGSERKQNSGFFDMGNGRFKVRLEGKVFTSSLDPAEKKMPKEIAALIKAARNSIPI